MVDTLSGNVADLVTEAAAKVPGRVALVDTTSGRSLTWEQTYRAAGAFAARLLDAGLEDGDRVANHRERRGMRRQLQKLGRVGKWKGDKGMRRQ